MNCNTQYTKIASITEKTLIVGIDVGSETHYARAFDWRNFEFTENLWFSAIQKQGSLHLRHGSRKYKKRMVKPL